jgi:hypothetical protein
MAPNAAQIPDSGGPLIWKDPYVLSSKPTSAASKFALHLTPMASSTSLAVEEPAPSSSSIASASASASTSNFGDDKLCLVNGSANSHDMAPSTLDLLVFTFNCAKTLVNTKVFANHVSAAFSNNATALPDIVVL